jgi:predicted Ser/Thr protein kinase
MIFETCPADHQLLSLAIGDRAGDDVSGHVASCPGCRRRVDRLMAQWRALREVRDDPPHLPWAHPDFGGATVERCGAGEPVETGDLSPAAPEAETADGPAVAADLGGDGPPTRIGKYLVVGELGEGGQAAVYRVVHPGLGRDLALKIAKTPMAWSEADRSLLAEEARALAELDHPGLLRVDDLDIHDGRLFVVMEYVRGRSLKRLAGDEPLGARRAAELVAQAARAAAAAHRRGFVHQDIKPQNILVDEHGRARLIDFGMARWRRAWSEDEAGPNGGTPEYMPPEQARGEGELVGPRSDVFALGAVLYELLTGDAPYRGGNRHEVCRRACLGEFDRGALRAKGVPRILEKVVLKAMSADVADRQRTADDLADELERFVRRPRRFAIGFGAAALIGFAAAIASIVPRGDHPSEVKAAGRGVSLQVWRGQSFVENLSGALPLRTGDRLVVRCVVPRRSGAVVYWLDSEGHVSELSPVRIEEGDASDRVVYPREGRVPLQGPPGTELVVVCAGRSRTLRDREAAALIGAVARLPDLPPEVVVRLSRSSTEVEGVGRGLGEPEVDSVDSVRATLERLRLRLRERFDFVEGLVVPHRAAD